MSKELPEKVIIINNFILFVGGYSPKGGVSDIYSSHDKIDDAYESLKNLLDESCRKYARWVNWAHILDIQTGEVHNCGDFIVARLQRNTKKELCSPAWGTPYDNARSHSIGPIASG